MLFIAARFRGSGKLLVSKAVAHNAVTEHKIYRAKNRADCNTENCSGGGVGRNRLKRNLFKGCGSSVKLNNLTHNGAAALKFGIKEFLNRVSKAKTCKQLSAGFNNLGNAGRIHVSQTLVVSAVGRHHATKKYRRRNGQH